MAADPTPPQDLTPLAGERGVAGDLPDALGPRYRVQGGRGRWRLYLDARTGTPSIEDHGDRLRARRADPSTVRDMAAIAAHRGWTRVRVRGDEDFRREAWLAGEALGLEVRGYLPRERDRQALDRRQAAVARDPAAADRLRIAEAVIRDRVAEPAVRAQLILRAQARVDRWLRLGARFAPAPDLHRRAPLEPSRAPVRERGRES